MIVFAATVVEVAQRGGDLRAHAARRKLAVGQVASRLARRQAIERALGRLAEVERHPVDAGQHHQRLRAELGREHRARQVLVDHRRDAVQVAGLASRATGMPPPPQVIGITFARSSASTAGNFDDAHRLRRRHDAPIAATRVLDEVPAVLARKAIGVVAAEEAPDRLGRGSTKPGSSAFTSTCVMTPLTGHRHAFLAQHVDQRLLQHVAHAALRVGHADVHRHRAAARVAVFAMRNRMLPTTGPLPWVSTSWYPDWMMRTRWRHACAMSANCSEARPLIVGG